MQRAQGQQAEQRLYRIPPSQRTAIGSEAGSSRVKKEEDGEESKVSNVVQTENGSGTSTDGVTIKTEEQDG
ncbi:hypothetical protein JCM24511_09899 [Saitozyma sp. JCM 24511]|nr:hypothetical protein JCM24511_09899 [Saitozyma sp. JCM 24511]